MSTPGTSPRSINFVQHARASCMGRNSDGAKKILDLDESVKSFPTWSYQTSRLRTGSSHVNSAVTVVKSYPFVRVFVFFE